eukprot:CAMPEP_0185914636 /NCGR_PEP_ID=MMETSP0924C-20121207/1500_1 /TAXON_ID=321610 /ORGANISM="Perkinsus chesapeaki, Strain ATCC PRA-65" /LENGTH=32 /DNA_ID= /DNA_START= /DNA_END= /DNA_ORIENTATION=
MSSPLASFMGKNSALIDPSSTDESGIVTNTPE